MKVIKTYTVEVDPEFTTITEGKNKIILTTLYFRSMKFSKVIRRLNRWKRPLNASK